MMWTAGRNQQLGELIAEVFRDAGAVPREFQAIVAGGPPGADKAAALDEQGTDRSQFLAISVGDVLTRMAARGLIPEVPDRPPLAGAELVHTEAQHVAKRIALVAVNDGWNVILDVTLASRPSAESWTYALRFSDFTVTAVYAGLTAEESIRRSAEAYARDEAEYEQGRGYGGRYLPPDAIRALDGPAATAARDSIRWVSGAEPASVTAGQTRRAAPRGGGRPPGGPRRGPGRRARGQAPPRRPAGRRGGRHDRRVPPRPAEPG